VRFADKLDTLHTARSQQRTVYNVQFYSNSLSQVSRIYPQIKVKVNQSTCIAPCMVQTTLKRSGMDHTAFNLQSTPCLPLPRECSPDGASIKCGGEHLIAAHYLFIDPERMKG